MVQGAVRDPYLVLGVGRDATAAQVSAAHRRLAKSHHPDLHPDGPETTARMRDINEAWEILSSPERRAVWDLEHPSHGTAASASHWSGGRGPIPARTIVRSQASIRWRTAAGDPRSARQATVRAQPRPERREPVASGFLDGPWAAVMAGALGLVILAAAVIAGRLVGV
jgi:hypothetical protein